MNILTKSVDMKNDAQFVLNHIMTLHAKCQSTKENALIVKTIIQFHSFNARSELQKKTQSLIYDARSRFYIQQIWKTHRERFLIDETSWFNKSLYQKYRW